MQVRVNGRAEETKDATTVLDYVQRRGLDPARVAVEVNRAIVKRAEFAATVLGEGDTVEIVQFVGGG
jgi:sulfur carrier protein